MQISEVMSRNVQLADPNMTIREAAIFMRDKNIGAMPVGENDRLVGVVTDRDLVVRGLATDDVPGGNALRHVMSDHVYYCFEDEPLERAGESMGEHQVHRMPVLNRDKRLVGMVALADLARAGDGGAQAVHKAVGGISEPTEVPRR